MNPDVAIFFGLLAMKNGGELLATQEKLIAAQWALIAANERLMELGEKPLKP